MDGFTKRNIYAYSLSLGAGMLAKYMIATGDKCILNGCVNYCTFYNIQDNVPFFKTNAWKLYDYFLGLTYYNVLKKKEQELKEVFGEDKANELLQSVRLNNSSLMDISEKSLSGLFGYSSIEDYY